MSKAPWCDRKDIVTEVAIGKVAMARGEHIGGPLDAPAGVGRHRPDRIIHGGAVFHFHKGEHRAAPRDQVNLAALGAKSVGHDAISLQSQDQCGDPF